MVDTDNGTQLSTAMNESHNEGREHYYMDIERMVNEGLGGGNVTMHNGLIDETTTDSMIEHELPKEER